MWLWSAFSPLFCCRLWCMSMERKTRVARVGPPGHAWICRECVVLGAEACGGERLWAWKGLLSQELYFNLSRDLTLICPALRYCIQAKVSLTLSQRAKFLWIWQATITVFIMSDDRWRMFPAISTTRSLCRDHPWVGTAHQGGCQPFRKRLRGAGAMAGPHLWWVWPEMAQVGQLCWLYSAVK